MSKWGDIAEGTVQSKSIEPSYFLGRKGEFNWWGGIGFHNGRTGGGKVGGKMWKNTIKSTFFRFWGCRLTDSAVGHKE